MKRRVVRGGSFFNVVSRHLRTTEDNWLGPERRYRFLGFRVLVKRRKP